MASFHQSQTRQLRARGRTVINADGVRPDPAKVTSNKNFPQPMSATKLQRFFGMMNYLANFMPGIAHKTEPLRKLVERGWGGPGTSLRKRWMYTCDSCFVVSVISIDIMDILLYAKVQAIGSEEETTKDREASCASVPLDSGSRKRVPSKGWRIGEVPEKVVGEGTEDRSDEA